MLSSVKLYKFMLLCNKEWSIVASRNHRHSPRVCDEFNYKLTLQISFQWRDARTHLWEVSHIHTSHKIKKKIHD